MQPNCGLLGLMVQAEKMFNYFKSEKMKKLFAISVLFVAFAAGAFAQLSATATASATIVTPLSITNAADMNFGNVAVGAGGGTVALSTAGARSITGDCALPTVTGTVQAAAFTIAGEPGTSYTITLPAAAATITSGANTMTVDTWSGNIASPSTIPGGGTATLNVGAVLHVAGGQAAGAYTSQAGDEFTVSINYN